MGNDRVFNGAAAATKALIRQTHRYGVWDAVSRTAEKDRFVNGLSSRLANCALFDDARSLSLGVCTICPASSFDWALLDTMVALDALIGLDAIAALALAQLFLIELRGRRVLALILKRIAGRTLISL